MSNAITHEIGPILSVTGIGPQTIQSPDLVNQACRGVKLYINIVTGTVTVTILGKDPKSGATWTILASTSLSAAGSLTILSVYPGMTAATNVAVSDVLPGTWRVQAAFTAGPATITINGCLIR